jgi:putative acetyltransferase
MIVIKRVDSNNLDFRNLVSQLDNDLDGRYGKAQKEYDKYNQIEFLDTVVMAYFENQAVGCGCFKKYDENTFEIKRMFVNPQFRGRGISKLILSELENWGAHLGYSKSILETGIKQIEAIGLYERFGYQRIDNYNHYIGMENSVCMAKGLKD